MARRALVEKRPFLVLSVIAAVLYYYLQSSPLPELYLIPIKGSAVGLLAIYAYLRHGSRAAKMLAVALVFASIGDMAIQIDLIAGAVAFFVFHVIALTIFLQHKGEALEGSDNFAFIALLIGTPIASFLLPYNSGMQWQVALYGLALGGMAAGAWASNFPRRTVGAGGVLFVISDLLIFSEMGPLTDSAIPGYLIWPIYYLGMFLITVGVVTTLRKRDPELRVVRGDSV